MDKIKVLFVCLGNICRSPTAQGIFEKMVKDAGLENEIEIDSAGTAGYHIGKAPDPRSTAHALKRGYHLAEQKCRKVEESDFFEYDYVIAMDAMNYADLEEMTMRDLRHKLHMMLSFGKSDLTEVPDPYQGGEKGFELVLDLLEDACAGLLEDIRKNYLVGAAKND